MNSILRLLLLLEVQLNLWVLLTAQMLLLLIMETVYKVIIGI